MSENIVRDANHLPKGKTELNVSRRFQSMKVKLKEIWNSQQRNLFISAIIAAIVAAIIVMSLWSASDTFRPLYGSSERYENSEIILPVDVVSK